MSEKELNKKSPMPPKFPIPKGWTLEQLKYLFAAKEEGMNTQFIAAALKKLPTEIKYAINNINWKNAPFYDPLKGRMKEEIRKDFLSKLVDNEDKKMISDVMKTEILVDTIERIIKPYNVCPEVYKPKQDKFKKHSDEDVGILLSDLHVGHSHTLEETNGISEYNLNVFKKRLNNLKIISSDIIDLHSQLYDMPKLHIFCLGDIVDGMNNAGSWSSVWMDMSIYDQMMQGFESISELIYYWLGMFKEINFYGVRGNHGRGAEQGSEKDYVNWDFICYKFIEARFKDNPRVKFNIPKSWYIFEQIKNHNFLLIHGDELSGGGSPISKVQTAENKIIGLLKKIPNYTLAGHFHNPSEQTTNNGKILLNGAFIGSDVYSLKSLQLGSYPVQKIFGIHDKVGVTWTYDIRLDLNKE
jgi:hypothetical protein